MIPRLLSLVLATNLVACGLVSSQSVYEGVRATQKARSTGTEPQPRELPTYDDYQREREKVSH
jgi:hypothetical protein